MAKSLRITIGETKVRYSPKMAEDTRGKLNALATVLRVTQRELLERMLVVYGQQYPQDVARADRVVNILNP